MHWLTKIFEDIQHGRHMEAYGLFLIGIVLVILGLVDVVSPRVILSAILLALSYLVFSTSSEHTPEQPRLDDVLKTREDFSTFCKMLPGVRDLRVYGPTAINILVAAADIKRFVLDTGGTTKVIIQEATTEAMKQAAFQLDDNLDFEQTLRSSKTTLDRLSSFAGFSYRLLPVNPGFSLVVVNADDRDGYVIFESHGFRDENIADRMHITIHRAESPRWFLYWVARFDAMWESSENPNLYS